MVFTGGGGIQEEVAVQISGDGTSLMDTLDGVEARRLDDDRSRDVELGANAVADEVVRRRTRDHQRSPREIELLDRRREVVENAVTDEDVPRKLDPRRLLEHTARFVAPLKVFPVR